jgi:hypothetical protein
MLRNDCGPIHLAVRASGLVDSGAQPVVLAAGIEDTDELCARAIPTFACTVGRSCNDDLPHLLVIATDHHEGRIRANPSEERMDRLLIRSDVRLGTLPRADLHGG